MKLFPEEQWREQRQHAMLGEVMSCRVPNPYPHRVFLERRQLMGGDALIAVSDCGSIIDGQGSDSLGCSILCMEVIYGSSVCPRQPA